MVTRWDDLTPEEFAIHADVWRRRQERAWDRLAVMVCQLTAPYRDKPLTPSQFLGRPLSGMVRQPHDPDEDDD